MESYNPDAAAADFQRSLSLTPANIQTETNLGFAYYQQKRFEKAEEQFLNVLSRKPSFPFALNNLSATYAQLGEWQRALEYSEKAIEQNPREVLFINTHTLNLIENDEILEATGFSNRSLKLDPFNPYSLRNSGILEVKSERGSTGVNILDKIETEHPDVEFIYYYLGKAYQSQGQIIKACKAFKRGELLGDSRSEKMALSCL